MVVIGGRESSNTRALYTVARRTLANTVLIEDASELSPKQVRAAHTIGITAGASTPGDIIEEVEKTMSDIIESTENFETLLEGSLKTLNTGDIVKGVITSISSTEVHVDLSANVTGIIPAEELAGSRRSLSASATSRALQVCPASALSASAIGRRSSKPPRPVRFSKARLPRSSRAALCLPLAR